MELEPMASAIGVSVPVLRFLLCFLATIPVSFLHRFVPGGSTGRHLYAAVTGAVLSYLSFGFSSNLHFLVPMLLGYASMLLCRPFCGIITFFLAFGYLIGWFQRFHLSAFLFGGFYLFKEDINNIAQLSHVYYMSGDAWKEGGIDSTGALMVITLKIISCVINYQDGLLKEDDLREAQKQNRLLKLPSLFEYIGYCLCCGSHFAGPVYEMKAYLEWTERKGIWKPAGKERPLPSPFVPTLRALLQAAFLVGQSLLPRWDRAKNVDILGVELAKSSVQLPLVWNIQVSTWLRHYVYERLIIKGKKPGFFQLLATQTVSAVWHGLYPGYMIFFVQSALMIAGSRAIYRWQQGTGNALLQKILALMNIAYTLLVLNYSCVGFLVSYPFRTKVA
nr:lysophospholipid acyltransferase 1-like [Ipomoea batatas]